MTAGFEPDIANVAPFIWGAYGLCALVVGGLVVRAVLSHRHWTRRLEHLEAEADGGRRA